MLEITSERQVVALIAGADVKIHHVWRWWRGERDNPAMARRAIARLALAGLELAENRVDVYGARPRWWRPWPVPSRIEIRLGTWK